MTNIDHNPNKTKLENAVTIEMAINSTEQRDVNEDLFSKTNK